MANEGAWGRGMSSFMDSFNAANQNRKQGLMQGRIQDRQDALFDAQMQQIADQKAKDAATSALMQGVFSGGMMAQGQAPVPGATAPVGEGLGVFPVESVQAPQKISINEIMGMSPEQQQASFGRDFGSADLSQVAGLMKALKPSATKGDFQIIEMDGEKGFGKYLVDKNSGKSSWVGGAKPEGSTAPDPQDVFKNERQLAKEWEGINKEFKSVDQQYNTIKEAGADPSGVGDIGMIFAMMKMFDPGSVVRESEFALAQNADSLTGILETQYEKLKEGEKLRPEQRAKFLDLADRLYSSTNQLYGRRLGEYKDVAKSYGFNVGRTIADVKRGGWEDKKPEINSSTSLQRGTTSSDPLGLGL